MEKETWWDIEVVWGQGASWPAHAPYKETPMRQPLARANMKGAIASAVKSDANAGRARFTAFSGNTGSA